MLLVNKVILSITILASLLSDTTGQCTLQTATRKFRRSVSHFSKNIIQRVAQEEKNNFAFSPFSIWTILSVLAEGAEGNTYEELRSVLKLNSNQCFKKHYYELINGCSVRSEGVIFERNGLVVADKYLVVNDTFKDMVKNQMKVADVISSDFSEPNTLAQTVNEYIAEKTYGNVNDPTQEEDFIDSVMVLIDTVFFKGHWKHPFDSNDTKVSVFYDDERREAGKVNLMTMNPGMFNLTNLDCVEAQVLELPYDSDGKYSMLIFLPYYNTRLSDVINKINKITLMAIFKKFVDIGPSTVEVSLPRFKMTTELNDLKYTLEQMGIKSLFDEKKSELPGISKESLYLGKLLQKAVIEVTEEGTVAAAVTSGFITNRSDPEKFNAEKPFLYLIVERPTQTILFAGAYSIPTED